MKNADSDRMKAPMGSAIFFCMIKLFSAQDNLGKGAALQAIQAANCMFGLPEGTGLKNVVRGV